MNRRLSAPVLVTVLSGVALLGGCGDAASDDQAGDDTSSASSSSAASASTSPSASETSAGPSTPAAAPLPACDSVWVDGLKLSFSYAGCTDGADTVKARRQPCEIGKPLLTYRNSFWAIAGGPVHEVSDTLAKDAGWHRALIQCGG